MNLPEAHLRRQIATELELIQCHRAEAIELLRRGEIDLPTTHTENIGGGKVLIQENQLLKTTFPLCNGYRGGEVGRWEGPPGNHVPDPIDEEQNIIDAAMSLLNNCGARILPGPVLGIPSGRLTAEIRAAVATLGMGDLPLVTLAGEVAA